MFKQKVFNKNFDLPNFVKFRYKAFSIPQKEEGIVSVAKKVYPKVIVKYEYLPKHSDVLKEDEDTIEVHCKRKAFHWKFIDRDLFYRASKHLEEMFKGNSTYKDLIDFDSCFDELPKDTSSCYPIYKKKGSDEAYNDSKYRFEKFLKLKSFREKISYLQKHPTTIFHRYTPKYKNKSVFYKIRQILGVPQFIVSLEVKFLKFFKDTFLMNMGRKHTIGLTKLQISNSISKCRIKALDDNRKILCGDISGIDKNNPSLFHKMIYHWILPNVSNIPNVRRSVLALIHYSCFTPIILKDKVVFSEGSTCSGSWFTTIFNTCVTYFILTYGYLVLYNRFPSEDEVRVQGDDFIMIIDDGDYKEWRSIFKFFGHDLKPGVTYTSDPTEDIDFLGYKWDINCEPYQSDEWCYIRVVYPEKFIELFGAERCIYRYLSIIFNLRDSVSMFKKFFKYDRLLRDKCMRERNPTFQLINWNGDLQKAVYPLEKFLRYGWTLL